MSSIDKTKVRIGAIDDVGKYIDASVGSLLEDVSKNKGALEFATKFQDLLVGIHAAIDKEQDNEDCRAASKKYITAAIRQLDTASSRIRERQIELSGAVKQSTKNLEHLRALRAREESRLEQEGKSKTSANVEAAREKRKARKSKAPEISNGSN